MQKQALTSELQVTNPEPVTPSQAVLPSAFHECRTPNLAGRIKLVELLRFLVHLRKSSTSEAVQVKVLDPAEFHYDMLQRKLGRNGYE